MMNSIFVDYKKYGSPNKKRQFIQTAHLIKSKNKKKNTLLPSHQILVYRPEWNELYLREVHRIALPYP